MASGFAPPVAAAEMLHNLTLAGPETLDSSMRALMRRHERTRHITVKQVVYAVSVATKVAAYVGEEGSVVGVIGAGLMGRTIVDALLDLGYPERLIAVSSRTLSTLEAYKARGVRVTNNNAKVANVARVLVLAVGAAHLPTVARDLRGKLRKRSLLVSIVVGVESAKLAQLFGAGVSIRAHVQPALLGDDDGAVVDRIREYVADVDPAAETRPRPGSGSSGHGGVGGDAGGDGVDNRLAAAHLCCCEAELQHLLTTVVKFAARCGIPEEYAEQLGAQLVLDRSEPLSEDARAALAAAPDPRRPPRLCGIAGDESKRCATHDADHPVHHKLVAARLPAFWRTFASAVGSFSRRRRSTSEAKPSARDVP